MANWRNVVAGGKYDSSLTRVAPLFDTLKSRDSSGQSWLPELLALPLSGSRKVRPDSLGALQEACWGANERKLMPPVALLSWLIRNLQPRNGQPELNEDRQKLLARDPAQIERALTKLRTGKLNRSWNVLEGPSFPDAFLSTNDAVIVIEGKRTERGPTTLTKWMPIRHQMLRHLDTAFEILGNRSLFGFFIVEGEDDGRTPVLWQEACAQVLTSEALKQSLPHRSDADRQIIAEAFIGATTWQMCCRSLQVPFSSLLQQIEATPA